MLANGTAVRHLDGSEGYVQHYMYAVNGHRRWSVEWDDGAATVEPEADLIDVEDVEWRQALEGVPDEQRCTSYYYRRCGLPAGHRTRRHRNCEISWDDDMAFKPQEGIGMGTTPLCPHCGCAPWHVLGGESQAFCSNRDCDVLAWNPQQSREELEAGVGIINIGTWERG